MSMRILFIIFLSVVLGAVLHRDAAGDERGKEHGPQSRDEVASPGAGVSRELARWRAAHYSNVSYRINVQLAPGAEMLKGTLKLGVTLDADAGDLVLDWRVVKREGQVSPPPPRVYDISANGNAVGDARTSGDHIIIPRASLKTGENVLQMSFESPIATSGSAVTRYLDREDNSEYLYTLFVPSDASTAFPCFDQPDLKARFQLSVAAPDTWKVITNSDQIESVNLPGENERGRATPAMPQRVFRTTEPLSTYQFAFAAGPFAEFKDESSPYGTRIFVRKSKAERARKELPEVMRLNRESVKFFENYFDFKFPFSKYDLVIVPEFAYGGMEHAGATFLREDSILFPVDPTANELAARADVMFHEAAHQWFGDLVTMRWFDDLWLKEGFATFMAYKAMETVMPQFNAWKVFHLRNKPLAYLTDATKGTTPIWQEIANLSAAKSAYGNIVYRKAPSMLRQAEFFLGPDKFQRAVQLLLKEHAYANAEWSDLVHEFERTSGRKLDRWADAWVKRRGMPDVRVQLSADRRGRIRTLALEQRDVLGEGGEWPMRVELLLAPAAGGRPTTIPVLLGGGGSTIVKEATGRPRPAYVFANYEDYGYGRFLLDDESRAAVIKNLGAIEDDFLRALLWGSLWDSVREAEMAPLDFVELGIRHAARERDEVALQFVLSRVQTAFTRYLSDAQKEQVAPRLEQMLSERMLHAETPGQRITYFRTLRDVATTRAARDELERILKGQLEVPGMTLRSRDRFDIIRTLIAAGDERGSELLRQQAEADKTDDGRRYAFAVAAAQPSAVVKRKYFESYLGDVDLPESWIDASLAPFNAAQQAELTLPYLEPALRELPKIKRTRKIFFVNSWLAAFIGGQCSEEAERSVQSFLKREATLDRDLRLKVLEASDALERCVRIRARYASAGGANARPAS